MFTASNVYSQPSVPIMAAVPSEPGIFPLKSLAFMTALMVCSTASAQATTIGSMRLDSSSKGLSVVARQQEADLSIADAISEIRRRSGLTWSQLAKIFNVSRRTVHSWANGAAVRAANSGAVAQLFERVRAVGDLPAFKVRDVLLNRAAAAPEAVVAAGEPPILVSDTTPFAHHLELKPGRTKVRRG